MFVPFNFLIPRMTRTHSYVKDQCTKHSGNVGPFLGGSPVRWNWNQHRHLGDGQLVFDRCTMVSFTVICSLPPDRASFVQCALVILQWSCSCLILQYSRKQNGECEGEKNPVQEVVCTLTVKNPKKIHFTVVCAQQHDLFQGLLPCGSAAYQAYSSGLYFFFTERLTGPSVVSAALSNKWVQSWQKAAAVQCYVTIIMVLYYSSSNRLWVHERDTAVSLLGHILTGH